MNNKQFKEEAACIISLIFAVITTICLWPDTSLGENLFWTVVFIIFTVSAVIGFIVSYTILTAWMKLNAYSFTKMKRIVFTKTAYANIAIVNFFVSSDENEEDFED